MKSGMEGEGCFPTGRHYPGIAHLLRVVASGLADEFDGQTEMHRLPVVSIDTETTGRDHNVDRVVEVACVIYREGQVVARHDWLVNPGMPIPKEAFDVHGISDDDVKDKPPFSSVALEILEAMRQGVPLAYNAEFDRDFLHAEFARCNLDVPNLPPAARKGVEWLDPLTWARELQKDAKSKSLGDVCERLGIDIGRAHRATDDAEAAAKVHGIFATDSRVPRNYAAFVLEQKRLGRIFDDERRMWRRA
ncbi:MAG: 3'-5' exonuclease [Polyangiaceae bacterium]|nr:3'-5' exonuclease [Polyangiaceae bacterium]